MKHAIFCSLLLVSRVASAAPGETPTITVGIQDYAHVSNDVIDRAERVVTRLYATVGVRATWMETIRPGEASRHAGTARNPLLINILTPAMSERMNLPEGTLGLAA